MKHASLIINKNKSVGHYNRAITPPEEGESMQTRLL